MHKATLFTWSDIRSMVLQSRRYVWAGASLPPLSQCSRLSQCVINNGIWLCPCSKTIVYPLPFQVWHNGDIFITACFPFALNHTYISDYINCHALHFLAFYSWLQVIWITIIVIVSLWLMITVIWDFLCSTSFTMSYVIRCDSVSPHLKWLQFLLSLLSKLCFTS